MSNNKYVITSNGSFYSADELYHYGVKGMKWGQRKALKYEARYTRKLGRAGKKFGAADYERSKGAEAYKKHDTTAKAFDKTAKQYEKQGNYLKAEITRKAAAAIRTRGENVKRQREQAAAYLEKRAAKLQEKASKYATKKRVDLGTDKVNSILNASKQKGFDSAKEREDRQRERDAQEKLGDSGYSVYNKIRGRS